MAHQHFLMYGTAWKKENTTKLVFQAVKAGFRSIDVAAQPRHYREDLVGEALRQAYSERIVTREDMWLQTKFTSISGQDPDNLPYDPTSPLPTQVEKSIESSLTNFRPETSLESTSSSYIDSLILHSPLPTIPQTVQVWSTLEKFVPHTIRSLGIANINLPTLKSIVSSSIVKPSFVQNRFYEDTAYDVELREFCKANGIVYQSFWTLTANPRLMKSEVVGEVAKKLDLERAVALYGLVLGLGGQWEVVVLDGTTREERMVGDLKGVDTLMSWAKEFPKEWEGFMLRFKRLIDEVE